MEIGTEISKKIRTAIKGKLQELGAYVDEELPDYIMVMVANKKNAQQMADDLSLFLGNNTIKFTVWLHGVLEKLRTTAVEPACLHAKLLPSDTSMSSQDECKGEESRALAVSSSRSDRLEGRVSSSAHEHHGRRTSSDRSSRQTSTVKPLHEHSAEAVIDIKPDLEDDDLITTDPRVTVPGKPRPLSSRLSNRSSARAEEYYRPSEVMRSQERSSSIYGRSYRAENIKEEFSRKRKAPMVSSVVRIQKGQERVYESEEDEEEEEDYGVQSRVSLPPKPERKPSLPPAKQANKNLILKAISEAQDSISKTTSVYTYPQRQTVPVAPRTRLASDDMNRAAIRLVQEHLHELLPQGAQNTRLNVPSRSLASRLQQELTDDEKDQQFERELLETARLKALDTRSFIMRKPELEQNPPIRSRLDAANQEEALPTAPRTVQAREKPECSPKFIVTLDGVPSPLASLTEHDMDTNTTMTFNPPEDHRTKPVNLSMTSDLSYDDEGVMMVEEEAEDQMEEERVKVKRAKVSERCKFWPACKSGDKCVYHHPTTQCRMFPSCSYGQKCLFIHPNCKYDGKCSKPNCPYTHISHRAVLQTAEPAPPQTSSVCRFFPDCKRTDCTFYHPKLCRFAEQCNRAGCTFYHPATSVPPRHALKWTKAQAS
ncbi:hypothetical protein Q7C36_011124 [Tachysurus vachellii]|uniref:Zinc finger CCCH domain-containing protein 14 n=1 Tax=Tachysurus vachellii TaxID=175792 RepID=A0AA88MXL4_TACVA|nr:hypothetical protein Q7C36_011124 [Tachysurus vachellii]